MPGFTYDQCDRIHRKMHNFDSMVSQFYQQNYSSMTGKQLMRQVDVNVKSRQRLMRNYESRAGKENSYEAGFRENVYLRKYGDGNMKRSYLGGRNAENSTQNYQSLQPNSYPTKSFPKPKHPLQQSTQNNNSLQQYSSIHAFNQSQQLSRISHHSLLQQGYTSLATVPHIRTSQQKQQTIHELNSQIKKIMAKYDYEFSNEEVRALVANDQRITLPSFRNQGKCREVFKGKIERKNDDKQNFDFKGKVKKSSGFIKVQESLSEQEIDLCDKGNQKQNNEFSPYSDEENYHTSKTNGNNIRPPAIKNQSAIMKNNNKAQNNSTNLPSHNQSSIFEKINIQQSNTHRPKNQQQQKQHVTFMCKSQLIQEPKPKTNINLNRGYNQSDKTIESSEKKRNRYLEGYYECQGMVEERKRSVIDFELKRNRRANRIMSGPLDKDRSEYLDRSIEQLNDRILQFEEKKKRLNINFKPFNLQQFKHKLHQNSQNEFQMPIYPSFEIQKSTREVTQSQKKQTKSDEKNESNGKQAFFKENLQVEQKVQQSTHEEVQKEQIHQETQVLQNEVVEDQNEKKIEESSNIEPSNTQQVECHIDSVFSNVQLCVYNDSSSIKTTNRINSTTHLSIVSCTNSLVIPTYTTSTLKDQFLTQPPAPKSSQKKLNRGSLLIKKPQNTKNAFELLLINLIKQIQLDQQFRNLKTWFQFCYQEENKWDQLKKIFDKSLLRRKESLIVRRQMSEGNDIVIEEMIVEMMQNDAKQLNKVFTVNANQHDPFFNLQQFNTQLNSNPFNHIHPNQNKLNSSLSQQPFSIPLLLQKYQLTLTHWLNHLHQKFSSQELINSGFSSSSLDLERKGFIEVQDLVRLINMNVGSGYRSRDLVMVWERVIAVKQNEKLKRNQSKEQSPTRDSKRIQFKYLLMALCKKERI